MTRTILCFLLPFLIGHVTAIAGPPFPFPSLPKEFVARVEANINDKNYSVTYQILYNQTKNQIAVYSYNGGSRFLDLYNFNTNEHYHVNRDTETCQVQPLPSASYFFLFGNKNGGSITMKSPYQFFVFSSTGTQWLNQTNVRGIKCNLWRHFSSVFTPETTFTLDWYFSSRSWATSDMAYQRPERAHVYGSHVLQNNTKIHFDHVYEFFDISTDRQDPEMYQTPAGIYCPGAKNTKPLPSPTSSFHLSTEILTDKTLSSVEEWYSGQLNIVVSDHLPFGRPTTSRVRLIQDFNTGTSYTIDKVGGKCNVSKINDRVLGAIGTGDHHIRMMTPSEFFNFNMGTYIYEGQRRVRGYTCDVWIAQTTDWPVPDSTLTTFEYYSATPDITTNLPDPLSFGIPVMLILKHENVESVFNIYDYNEEDIDPGIFDTSQCFNYTGKKDLSFLLPGSYDKLVLSKAETFKRAVVLAIWSAGSTAHAQLSPIRITNIQIDYADTNDIIIEFTVLDKAPVIGDVTNPVPEEELDVVVTSITNAINAGKLVVQLDKPGWDQTYHLTATPNSLSVKSHEVYFSSESNASGNI